MIVDSLCPMDPIEAGEMYRMEKYKDFVFQAKKVGTFDTPEVQRVLKQMRKLTVELAEICLLYTSPSPRDATLSRMPSSA